MHLENMVNYFFLYLKNIIIADYPFRLRQTRYEMSYQESVINYTACLKILVIPEIEFPFFFLGLEIKE